MNDLQKLALMKERVNKMEQSPKNIKASGCLNALRREVRNLEAKISEV